MNPIIAFVSQIPKDELEAWLVAIKSALPNHDIVPFGDLAKSQYDEIDVAIVANPNPVELACLPNLKWVQSLWAGVERLLSDMPEAHFEIVRMTDPQLGLSMAEAVLAWTLYLHRDMPLYASQQKTQTWLQHPLPLASDRNVGLLGLGKLGQMAAITLKNQGFNVLGWSRTQAELEGVETFSGPEGLNQLLTKTDILVVLLPLTDETNGLLNQDRLAKLPKEASLINFARGPIVEEAALLDLLDMGHLNHAVLDVFATEPLPMDSVLWVHAKTTVLPHISAPTNIKTASKIAAGNIRRFREIGKVPDSVERSRGY